MGKQKRPTKLYISVGSSSAAILSHLKTEIDALADRKCKVAYLAVDSTSAVHVLEEKKIYTFCPPGLKGEGSGMNPYLAFNAFMEARKDFLKKIFEEIAPAENIIAASVIGAPGRGGTAAGMSVPICLALKESNVVTINYHMKPDVVSQRYGKSNPIQTTFSDHVLKQVVRYGIKTAVIDEAWILKEAKITKSDSLQKMRRVMYDHIARAMKSMYFFWTPDKDGFTFWDPNDMRKMLQGDGFLKFADTEVNLAEEDYETEVTRAFDEIVIHNLYVLDGEISTVFPLLYGEWRAEQEAHLHGQISRFVDSRNKNPEKGIYIKQREFELNGGDAQSKGQLAVIFSTAPVEHREATEALPDFGSDMADLTAAVTTGDSSGKALGQTKGPHLTRYYRSIRALLQEALAGKDQAQARFILSQGDPYLLRERLVRDSVEQTKGSVVQFDIQGPELGEQLMQYMNTPDDLKFNRGNEHRILMERLETIHSGGSFISSQWKEVLFCSIAQALAERHLQLPRYIVNKAGYQRKLLPAVESADELRENSKDWRDVRREEDYRKKGESPLAQLALVRVVMQKIFDSQDPRFLALIEPIDSRTQWQMICDALVTRCVPKSFRRPLRKSKPSESPSLTALSLEQSAPASASLAPVPQHTPQALEELNGNLLTEPVQASKEMVLSQEVTPPHTILQ